MLSWTEKLGYKGYSAESVYSSIIPLNSLFHPVPQHPSLPAKLPVAFAPVLVIMNATVIATPLMWVRCGAATIAVFLTGQRRWRTLFGLPKMTVEEMNKVWAIISIVAALWTIWSPCLVYISKYTLIYADFRVTVS